MRFSGTSRWRARPAGARQSASCSRPDGLCAPPPFGRRGYQSARRRASTARDHLADGRSRLGSVSVRSRYGHTRPDSARLSQFLASVWPPSGLRLASPRPHLDLTSPRPTSSPDVRPNGQPGVPPLVGRLGWPPLGWPAGALRTPDLALFPAIRPETRLTRSLDCQDLGILAGAVVARDRHGRSRRRRTAPGVRQGCTRRGVQGYPAGRPGTCQPGGQQSGSSGTPPARFWGIWQIPIALSIGSGTDISRAIAAVGGCSRPVLGNWPITYCSAHWIRPRPRLFIDCNR